MHVRGIGTEAQGLQVELPRGLRMAWPLRLLNWAAALIFLGLGIKGYWDHSGWTAFIILAATLGAGWIIAWTRKLLIASRAQRIGV